MLSRSCKAEQASRLSLGNREDEACDETEPEELPEASRIILRTTERGSLMGTRLSVRAERRFFFVLNQAASETRQARRRGLKNKIFARCLK